MADIKFSEFGNVTGNIDLNAYYVAGYKTGDTTNKRYSLGYLAAVLKGFASRKTICFRVMSPPDTSFLETIPVLAPVSIDDLIAQVPTATKQTVEVYADQAGVEPLDYEYSRLREDQNIYITYETATSAEEMYQLLQQLLALQTASSSKLNNITKDPTDITKERVNTYPQ